MQAGVLREYPAARRTYNRTYNARREQWCSLLRERESFIDNLLVRIHYIIVMIKWTGLAPWEFEFPFPGSLTSTSLLNFFFFFFFFIIFIFFFFIFLKPGDE